MTPTQRTLAELRKLGYMAAVVEKWIPQTKRRVDLFGVIDVVAIGDAAPYGIRTLGVQATSGSNVASRVTKILEARWPAPSEKKGTPGGALILPRLLAAGWRIEVWGWRKSRRTSRWEVRRVVVEPSG